MRLVADLIEKLGDRGKRRYGRIPGDDGEGPSKIQANFDNSRHGSRDPLNQPNAGGAVHAFEVELDRRKAVRQAGDVPREEGGVVEIRKGPAGTLGGLSLLIQPFPEPVEAAEPMIVDDLVGEATTGTTELQFGFCIDQARRNREAAVIAEGCRAHGSTGIEYFRQFFGCDG